MDLKIASQIRACKNAFREVSLLLKAERGDYVFEATLGFGEYTTLRQQKNINFSVANKVS